MTSLPATLIPQPYNCLYSLRHSRRLSGRVSRRLPASPKSAAEGHKLPFRGRNPVAMPDSITIARRIWGGDDFDGMPNAPA